MLTTDVRVIGSAEAAAYQALRLRSLQEHPEAFGSSYEDEAGRTLESVQERLRPTEHHFTVGACRGSDLVGIAAFSRYLGVKTRHRGIVGGMYVAPEARGCGVGQALLLTMIERAKQMSGLEEMILAVTVGNNAARSIYLAAGFVPSHVEKRYIKVADRYYDIEWMTLLLGNKIG